MQDKQLCSWIDPKDINTSNSGFSMSIATILGGLGAEQHIPTFRKHNFGKQDIEELTEEDLIIMGVQQVLIRRNILTMFKKKFKSDGEQKVLEGYEISDAVQLLTNSLKQLQRIRLAILTNALCLQKDKTPHDELLLPNVYSTTIILDVIDKIDEKLTAMGSIITNNITKDPAVCKKPIRKKKIVISAVGGTLVAILTYCLVKSFKVSR